VPQFYLDFDRTKAKSMEVALGDIFDTLQIYLGSLYVNDLNLFGRTYQVTLGTLVRVQAVTGPDKVERYNMYPSAEINGNQAPGGELGASHRPDGGTREPRAAEGHGV
jgi:multidrug efflux pump subunit AcrB